MGALTRAPRVLADTNAFFFWLDDDPKLTPAARQALASGDQAPLLSVVSLFELATKHRIGKLRLPAGSPESLATVAVDQGFELLPLDGAAAIRGGAMVGPHKDPFDRLIIAQALLRGLPVVTSEAIFEAYGVRRIW